MSKLVTTLILLTLHLVLHSQEHKDSLWAVWSDTTLSLNTRLEALEGINYDQHSLYMPANLDSALYYSQLLYDVSKANGLKKWMAEGLGGIGNYYNAQGQFQKAIEFFEQSRTVAFEIGNEELVGRCLYNMGLCNWKLGNLEAAFPSFTQAAEIFAQQGNIRLESYSLDKLGMIYFQQGDPVKGVEYLERALALREEYIKTDEGPRDRMAIAMMRQSIAYVKAQIDDSLQLTETAPASMKDIEEVSLESDSLLGFLKSGQLALEAGQTQKAKQFFELGISKAEQEGNNLKLSEVLNMVGQEYLLRKDSVQALPFVARSLAMAQKGGELGTIGQRSLLLHHIYKATGQYKKSLASFQLFIIMRDSILNLENAKAVARTEIQADYDQQKALDDLENEKQLAIEKQKQEAQRRLTFAVSIGLLLISLLTLLVFNRLKVTRQQKSIIEEQKKKVEQSEKYKEQFLANMSHEIRTPMHAISGMVKILERNEKLPEQQAYLDAMQLSSDNLVVILNDVLDLSKIEAGKLDIQQIPMQPASVLENVTQILQYKAAEKGLTLSCTIEDEVPLLVQGDPVRLNQILTNLVGNAIKFTEEGGVDIQLKTVGEQLQFSIQDTGIGISEVEVDRIFEAFEQASDGTGLHYSGTGLGLSISKELVKLQNGAIWVESEEGQGSTFYVQLPLITLESGAASPGLVTEEQLQAMATALKGIRILLAEDNAFNQMIAQDDLIYYVEEVAIEVVENGALAVAEFNTGNYDLILMDVQMPEVNGFAATRQIRQLEAAAGAAKGIPIIAMTASLLKSEIEKCYQAGMDAYIPKPYQMDELIGRIYEQMFP